MVPDIENIPSTFLHFDLSRSQTSRIVIARRIMEEDRKKIVKVVEGRAFQELLHLYKFIHHLLSWALL
jgi:hypothetical protein